MDCYIYVLTSDLSEKIYVGSTIHPEDRLKTHRKSRTLTKGGAITKFYVLDKTLKLNIIKVVDETERAKHEGYYLNLFIAWHYKMLNKKVVSSHIFKKKKNIHKLSKSELIWLYSIRRYGDARKISLKYNVNYQKVYSALRFGEMEPEIFNVIAHFYKHTIVNKNIFFPSNG